MIPFAPSLTVRPLAAEDGQPAAALINQLLLRAPFSAPIDDVVAAENLFGQPPPTMLPVRWQQRQLLGAWRAGDLLGLADIATGLDSDSLGEPDYRPLGLLRFLVLPARPDLVVEAADVLLGAAHQFWRSSGVGYVKAYHISTGYPCFQAGAGLLPGDWADQVRVLTERQFRFTQRYYLLARQIDHMIEETVPQGGLSLAFRGDAADRRYQVFFRRTELIAEARLLQRHVQRTGQETEPGNKPAGSLFLHCTLGRGRPLAESESRALAAAAHGQRCDTAGRSGDSGAFAAAPIGGHEPAGTARFSRTQLSWLLV